MKPTCSLRQCAICAVAKFCAGSRRAPGSRRRWRRPSRRSDAAVWICPSPKDPSARRIRLCGSRCRRLSSATTWNSSRMNSFVRLRGLDDRSSTSGIWRPRDLLAFFTLAHPVAVLQVRPADSRSHPRRRSSPPRTCTPWLFAAPVLTGRRTALPSSTTNTASSFTADAGTIMTGCAGARPPARASRPTRNATLAFISGRRYPSGLIDLHFHLHGGLLAVGLGRHLLDEAVVLAVGKGVGRDDALLIRMQLGEIVLAISSSTSRSFRSASETT